MDEGGVAEGFGQGLVGGVPDLVEGGGGFAFGGLGLFEELGIDGFDDVGEGDLGGVGGEEVAAILATLGDDEIGLFQVREDLH